MRWSSACATGAKQKPRISFWSHSHSRGYDSRFRYLASSAKAALAGEYATPLRHNRNASLICARFASGLHKSHIPPLP